MKIKIIILALLIVSICAPDNIQAQRRRNRQVFRAYPVFGATASQIRGDELKGFDKWGFSAGVGTMLALTNDRLWNLSLEADFSQRGAFNNTNDPYSLIDFTMNYVDIPVTLHFTDPYGGMTFGVGLIYSRLVKQPNGLMLYNSNYFVPDTSDMSFLKNDFSVALDVRFAIWRGLTLNLRYQHSILPVKKNWQFTEHLSAVEGDVSTWSNNCYNSSVTMRVMYVFGDNNHRKYAHKKGKSKKHRR